jgi:hypothetical protein
VIVRPVIPGLATVTVIVAPVLSVWPASGLSARVSAFATPVNGLLGQPPPLQVAFTDAPAGRLRTSSEVNFAEVRLRTKA